MGRVRPFSDEAAKDISADFGLDSGDGETAWGQKRATTTHKQATSGRKQARERRTYTEDVLSYANSDEQATMVRFVKCLWQERGRAATHATKHATESP